MKKSISMIPGPVSVPKDIYELLARDEGAGKYEHELLPLYHETGRLLAKCMGTSHDVVIMSGEGMLALWAGLKSCLQKNDRVLAIATGVFGEGIGQMAASLGCDVKTISYPFNTTINDLDEIEKAIAEFKPHMITAVHCETPSGTLNPLDGLGKLKKKYAVPLLYVDAVSSLGGAEVCMDEWHIDLLLGAPQKCLSAPPSLCFLGVSPKAWDMINAISYQGYDALLPWKDIQKQGYFPYTPYWEAIEALHKAVKAILDEGLQNVFQRHENVASMCRNGLQSLGLTLWADANAVCSPTVTTVHIPKGFTWEFLQKSLQEQGLIIGGGLGPLDGKVFRLGHMGSQAQTEHIKQSLEIIKKTLSKN